MQPDHAALCRHVEEAGLNALPAPFQIVLDGWLLRFAHGFTRRANSATRLPGAPAHDPVRTIEACERLYAAKGLPPLFRVLSFQDAALDQALTARGYAPPEGETSVLWTRLAPQTAPPRVELTEARPPEEWLAAQATIAGAPVAAQRAILDRLAIPAVFAAARLDGPATPLAALACGAVHDGMLVLQMVVTDPAARRRGLARDTLAAISAWAWHRARAHQACLQVASANTPAFALYHRLGYRTELYRYHYRRQPS